MFSPREILQLSYKFGFIDDADTWLMMLKKRNVIAHVYNEVEVNELISLVRDEFLAALTKLEETLKTNAETLE